MSTKTKKTNKATATSTPKFTHKQIDFLGKNVDKLDITFLESLRPASRAGGTGRATRFAAAGYPESLLGSMERALKTAVAVKTALENAGVEFTIDTARKNLYTGNKEPVWLPFALQELGFNEIK